MLPVLRTRRDLGEERRDLRNFRSCYCGGGWRGSGQPGTHGKQQNLRVPGIEVLERRRIDHDNMEAIAQPGVDKTLAHQKMERIADRRRAAMELASEPSWIETLARAKFVAETAAFERIIDALKGCPDRKSTRLHPST